MVGKIEGASFDRRQFLRGMGVVGAMVAVPSLTAACGGSAASSAKSSAGGSGGNSKNLKIGLIIPLGGVFQSVGQEMKNGLQLYLDTHGNKLGGRTVDLVVGDEGAAPADAQQTAQRLIYSEKIDFATGVVTSSAGVALRNTFDTAKVPLIISNANVTELSTKSKSPYVYRTSATFAQQGGSAGKWFYDNLAKSDVWVMADDFVGGHDIADSFSKAFTAAGGTIGGQVFTPFQKTTDFEPYFTQVKNANAKGIFAFFGGSEAIAFMKQYHSFGLAGSIPAAGQGSLVDSAVLSAEGADGLNFPATGNYYVPVLDNAVNKDFRDKYKAKFGHEPAYYACSSYDAAQLIDLALHKTNGSTSDANALVKALENPGEFKSPRGPMRMDAATHNPVEHFYVYENVQENGQTVPKIIADCGEYATPSS